MQTCNKCGGEMEPKVNLNLDAQQIFHQLATESNQMIWSCPRCGIERAAKLKASEVDEIKAFVRRKKKQWWQFWIR
jgi:hypothetical protein